ncbi:MAG: single-stranded DNA-binding protein [Candidatus Nomurabacteria bacterium]|jgi:single-strand DNA-binding protein|nr:single-stranded DNA-binding protein [Candidatus Nomurabacteria bacterium]
MAYNRVVLLGNLTRDPETRMAGSGSVTSFSVAVNDTWVDKNGQKQERVNFIECEAWGARGETIAKYFTKGRQILVEGSLRQDTWDDKDTGKKRSAIKVNVDAFSFVNDGKGGGSSVAAAQPTDDTVVTDVPEGEVDLSEIPF